MLGRYMSSLTYAEIKACFEMSEDAFRKRFAGDKCLMESVIATIANSPNDNGWPLAMLGALKPQFASALKHWSAGGYEEIRHAQESDNVMVGTSAHNMETHFPLLPHWRGEATHVSNDSGWFSRLECGTLELRSFMGCCAPGYTFAYVSEPTAVLKFSSLQTARLIGALTTENLEHEVLLPKGATFRVVSVHKEIKTICLSECSLPNPSFHRTCAKSRAGR